MEFFKSVCGAGFAKQFIAITLENSSLAKLAIAEDWLAVLPVWEFVGGRYSATSAVGLLVVALAGGDCDKFLSGAQKMDELTRKSGFKENPCLLLASVLALSSKRSLCVVPYRDRLSLSGLFLQQLFMESLGKSKSIKGKDSSYGFTVFGNKGPADQHSYMQQLVEGIDDTILCLLQVKNSQKLSSEISNVRAEDFLTGFFYGTRSSFQAANRDVFCLSLDELNENSLGGLIALFERTVGFIANYWKINAYNQPGVEQGKRAANQFVNNIGKVVDFFKTRSGMKLSIAEIEQSAAITDLDKMGLFYLLEYLVSSPKYSIGRDGLPIPQESKYFLI